MPICPVCKEEIETLINVQSGVQTWHYDGSNYDEIEFLPDDATNDWRCPLCDAIIADTETKANTFFEENYNCDNCGKSVSKSQYKKGEGLCRICVDTIN